MPCTKRTEESRYARHCAAKREGSALRQKAFAKLKPAHAGDAPGTGSTRGSSSSSRLGASDVLQKARLIANEHYFPTWNMR